MAKKNKTLKQKIASDKRLIDIQKSNMTSPSFSYTYSDSSTKLSSTKPTHNREVHTYTHIAHDLRKTLVLTTLIVLAQTLLYYFMYFS